MTSIKCPLFRPSSIFLAGTTLLCSIAAIAQFTQPTLTLENSSFTQPTADRTAKTLPVKAIDSTGGVWCGRHLQSCLE